MISAHRRHPVHVASNLAFRRIADFLTTHGTTLDLDRAFPYQPDAETCLRLCRLALASGTAPTRRGLHDGRGLGRVIVRRDRGRFLNKHHRDLEGPDDADGGPGSLAPVEADGGAPPDGVVPTFMLDVEARGSQLSCGWT